jgi:hypothetical protein
MNLVTKLQAFADTRGLFEARALALAILRVTEPRDTNVPPTMIPASTPVEIQQRIATLSQQLNEAKAEIERLKSHPQTYKWSSYTKIFTDEEEPITVPVFDT